MKEKLLFIMPEPLEELLFASTVMSQYLISRMVMGRPVDEVVIVCRYEELHSYLKACWAWAVVVVKPDQQQLSEAAFVFEFEAQSCYRITQAVKKHVAEAFAIQLGVGLMRFLPPVLIEDRPEEVGTILVAERNKMDGTDESWDWLYREAFIELLNIEKLPVTFLGSDAGWQEMKSAVGRASVVVGVRSSVTLVAAAANRLVVELSPDDKGHTDWFRKKECGTYRMIYGKLTDMTDQFVAFQLGKLMNKSAEKKVPQMAVEAVNV